MDCENVSNRRSTFDFINLMLDITVKLIPNFKLIQKEVRVWNL